MKIIVLLVSALIGSLGSGSWLKAEISHVTGENEPSSLDQTQDSLLALDKQESVAQPSRPTVEQLAAAIAQQLLASLQTQNTEVQTAHTPPGYPEGTQVVYMPEIPAAGPVQSLPSSSSEQKPKSKDDVEDEKAMGHFLHALGTIGYLALNPKADPVSHAASVFSDLLYVASMPFRSVEKRKLKDLYLRALEQHIVAVVSDPDFID